MSLLYENIFISLQAYYSLFQPGTSQNIFHVLAKEILPTIKRNTNSLDEDTTEMIDDLESYLDKYTEKEIRSTQKALHNMKTKIWVNKLSFINFL